MKGSNIAELVARKLDVECVVLEVGGRVTAGSLLRQEPYYGIPKIRVMGFEADPEACARLKQEAAQLEEPHQFFPYALGARDESRELFVTKFARCSSLFRPNESFVKSNAFLGDKLDVVDSVQIHTRCFSAVSRELNLSAPHFAKMDIQGAELSALRGMGDAVDGLVGAILEVEFDEVYENQPLAWDIFEFMHKKGFRLMRFVQLANLPRSFHGSTFPGPVGWGDALFFRDAAQVSIDLLPHLALMSAVYTCDALMHESLGRLRIDSRDFVRSGFENPGTKKRGIREVLRKLIRQTTGKRP